MSLTSVLIGFKKKKSQISHIILCLNEKHVILHPAPSLNGVQIEGYENSVKAICMHACRSLKCK